MNKSAIFFSKVQLFAVAPKRSPRTQVEYAWLGHSRNVTCGRGGLQQ